MNNIEKSQKASKTAGTELKAAETFAMMGEYLAKGDGKSIVEKVGAVFQFDIWVTKGEIAGSWEIDLKNGNGHVKKGTATNPDATFTMSDEDYSKI
jgi:hypothetical protein